MNSEDIWVFPKIEVPQNEWFIMENPMNKWMIWEVLPPLFLVQHPGWQTSGALSLTNTLPFLGGTLLTYH